MFLSIVLKLAFTASVICSPVSSTNNNVKRLGYFATHDSLIKDTYFEVSNESFDMLKEIGASVAENDSKYFYNAKSSEGRITEIREIRNDVDSLNFMINKIKYVYDSDQIPNNSTIYSILSYIRTINRQYVGEGFISEFSWSEMCGDYGADVNEPDYYSNIGLGINEFFSLFLNKKEQYNSSLHRAITKNIYSKPCFLINPISLSANIDLIHMVAVIQVCINPSLLHQQEKWVNDVGSWAGDLQTEASLIVGRRISSFDDVLYNRIVIGLDDDDNPIESTDFGISDLMADVDGINIAKEIKQNPGLDLSSVISQYYFSLGNDVNHFRMFISNIGKESSDNGSSSSLAFQKSVFDMMHLSLDNDGNALEETNSTSLPKYRLLYKDNGVLPTKLCRWSIAAGFCNYCLGKAQLQSTKAYNEAPYEI
jgi:hypothetical protein